MRKIVAWLSEEKSFSHFWRYLPELVGIKLFVAMIASSIARVIFPPEMLYQRIADVEREEVRLGFVQYTFEAVFLAPLWEETVFRLVLVGLPLWMFWFVMRRAMNPYIATTIVLGSAASFGYAHGTVATLLIQGCAGVVLAIVFLKWSEYGRRPWRGLLASAALHGTFNASGLVMALAV